MFISNTRKSLKSMVEMSTSEKVRKTNSKTKVNRKKIRKRKIINIRNEYREKSFKLKAVFLK